MQGLLISFFDSNNLGDLLLSKTMYEMLEERGIEVTCIDFCSSREISKEALQLYSSMEKHIRNVDKNRSKIKTKYLIPLMAFLKRTRKKRWAKIENTIATKDFVIIGGGNMLMDYDIFPNYSYVFSKYIRIAQKYQKQVHVLGIGAGPFRFAYEQKIAVKAIGLANYASTRDALSAKMLGIEHISRDPAFMLKRIPVNANRDIICVSLIDANNSVICREPHQYVASVTNIIEELAKYGKIVLYSTEIADYEMVQKVCAKIPIGTAEVSYIQSVDELLELYSRAKLVIGSRMHSLIIAMTQDIPTIAISWSGKVEELYRMASMTDCIFSIDALFESEVIKCAKDLMSTNDDKTSRYVCDCKRIIEDEYNRLRDTIMN